MPCQNSLPHEIKLSPPEQQALDKELEKFKQFEIIEWCKPFETDSFYSNLFPRAKKDGSVRIILNLKKLNEFVRKRHFNMETSREVIQLMTQGYLHL